MSAKILKTLLLVFGILAFVSTASAQRILEDGWGTDSWGSNEPQTTETVTDPISNESFAQGTGPIENSGNVTIVTVENEISETPLAGGVEGVSISVLENAVRAGEAVRLSSFTTELGWEVRVYQWSDGRITAIGISSPRDTSAPPTDREVREIVDSAPPPSPPPSPTPVPTPTFTPPPSPTLTFTANPASIVRGETSRLSWSSNADSCIADCISGDCVEWDANPAIGLGTYTPTSGSQVVSPDVTATYRLSCFTSAGGFAQAEQTISVGQLKWREIIPRLPGLFLFDQFFARR